MFIKITRPSTTSLVLFVFALGMISQSVISRVIAHGGDANLVHACVKNSNGSVRIVSPNDACDSNETALDWTKDGGNGIGMFLTNQLTNANFVDDNLAFRNFSGVNFSSSDLSSANIDHSDFSDAIMVQATIQSTSAINTNFSGSNFTSAVINGSIFDSANFTGVNFTGATGHDSSYVNTNFTNANFTDAAFENATGFGTANLTGVTWSNTVCPDGTNSDNNGNTCEGHLVP